MKKDLIFAPIMLLLGVALCLLKWTGMPAHIAISVVGAVVLLAYTALTRKEWKIPALEIIMRACYGVALITGIVLTQVHGVAPLGIAHKIFCVLFIALLIVLLASKAFAKKEG